MKLIQLTKNQLGKIYHYRHRTGLEWIHISNQSKNNVFTIGFKTTIQDNTGLPHILEHLTLASSRNHKKNPFFNMLSRSYSNFMNALTGDDLTLYPFSTVNSQDYENLLKIYLDCCFFPTLSKLDFMQEGWRYQDGKFQGVVYNEMKGVVSDPSSFFMIEHQKELYTGSCYGYNSGGDPLSIPTLEYEKLVQFHQKKYHPSNAFIYTFGDMDIERPMAIVEEFVSATTNEGGKSVPDSIELTRRWTSPKVLEKTGPLDGMLDPSQQDRFTISFLTNDHKDLMESYTLKLISDLLLDGAASPMYKALIESKLGTDYAPTTGYSTYSYTTHQSFGVQGCTDHRKVKEAIHDTLISAHTHGFAKERIESVLRQLEMGVRHKTSMFGMNLGWNTLRYMVHGGEPLEALELDKNLKELRRLVQQPGYIASKIKEYYLDNTHVLDFLMTPDPDHGRKVAEQETELVNDYRSRFTKDQEQEWKVLNDQLIEKQNEKSDLTDLPILSLNEISKLNTEYPTTTLTVGDTCLTHRKVDTNGIAYLYLKLDISQFNESQKAFVPLLCRSLTSLGTKSKPLEVLDEQIRLYSGGISASAIVLPDPLDTNKAKEYIEIYGTCLEEQIEETVNLIKEILEEVDWSSQSEFNTCLNSYIADLSQRVVGDGHHFAMSMAASALTPYAYRNEQWNGLSQLKFLESIDKQHALTTLETMMDQVRASMVKALVISQEHPFLPQMKHLLSLFQAKDQETTDKPLFVPAHQQKSHQMDLGINFVAQSFVCVPYNHPDSPTLKLLSSILTSQFLHTELREKGGAYGGSARYAVMSGLFHFMTYRDPLGYQRTLNTFSESIKWIQTNGITDQMMEEAKLDALKEIDVPINVGNEGRTQFLYEDIEKEQQMFRDGIFAASKEDVMATVRYLKGPSSIGVIGESLQ